MRKYLFYISLLFCLLLGNFEALAQTSPILEIDSLPPIYEVEYDFLPDSKPIRFTEQEIADYKKQQQQFGGDLPNDNPNMVEGIILGPKDVCLGQKYNYTLEENTSGNVPIWVAEGGDIVYQNEVEMQVIWNNVVGEVSIANINTQPTSIAVIGKVNDIKVEIYFDYLGNDTYKLTGYGAETYTWTSEKLFIPKVAPSIQVKVNQPTMYYLKGTTANCGLGYAEILVEPMKEPDPFPGSAIEGPLQVCANNPYEYTYKKGDDAPLIFYTWEIEGGKILQQGNNKVIVTWDANIPKGKLKATGTGLAIEVAISPSDPLQLKLTANYTTVNLKNPKAVTLTADCPNATSYSWLGKAPIAPNTYAFIPEKSGYYFVEAYSNCSYAKDSVYITVIAKENRHYIHTLEIKKEGVKNEADLPYLAPTDYVETTTYYDNLARAEQQVVAQQSPGGKDIVQPIIYDAAGIASKQYLPYTGGTDGNFKIDAIPTQKKFYQNTPDVAVSAFPFVESVYEKSPLATVQEQGAVGKTWTPISLGGEGKTVKQKIGLINLSEKIYRFTYTYPENGYSFGKMSRSFPFADYVSNQLLAQETTDEQGIVATTYTNKTGQVLCKKVTVSPQEIYTTYYIYDDFGQLRFVIPPIAVDQIPVNVNWQADEAFIHQYCYAYQYDAKGRMTASKAPGAAAVEVVYNKRDKVVLVQDGKDKLNGKWQFVKYDAYGRAVYTGLYLSKSSRSDLQALADQATILFENKTTENKFYYYSNVSFPILEENQYELHIVQYYDHYDFNEDGNPDVSFDANFNTQLGEKASQPFYQIKGAPTGSQVKILGKDTWLQSVSFYDDEGAVIQVQADNHVGGKDLLGSSHDFEGKPLATIHAHSSTLDQEHPTVTLKSHSDYDFAGRVTASYLQINAEQETCLGKYSYNEVGQLVQETLVADVLKSSYTYHERGWLSKINSTSLGEKELFGVELSYEKGNAPRYDGNASEVSWKNKLDETLRKYSYTYDGMSRLTKADYTGKGTEAFSLKKMSYDKNGNILALSREGLVSQKGGENQYGPIDELTYSYDGNKLQSVSDAAATEGLAGDFEDKANVKQEYIYDVQGNLVADKNKGIISIVYNHLNLPTQIYYDQEGENKLEYTYDATGNVLTKTVYENGNMTNTTTYAGRFLYENGYLKYIHTSAGRALSPKETQGTSFSHEYHLLDHQGNLRIAYRPSTEIKYQVTAEQMNAATEEVEFDHVKETRSNELACTGASSAKVDPQNPLGPWKTLYVNQGDLVETKVKAVYKEEDNKQNPISLLLYLNQLQNYTPSEKSGNSLPLLQAGVGYVPQAPKKAGVPQAYLRYIFYDLDSNYVSSGITQVSENAKQNCENLSFNFKAEKTGFLQIYVASEGEKAVWFDDLEILYKTSPIVQSSDYDPWGMNLAGIEKHSLYPYQYNGQSEKQKHLKSKGYFYETPNRMYDPQLGRFHAIDPLADEVPGISPYQFGFNNPIAFQDPSGLTPLGSPGPGAMGGAGSLAIPAFDPFTLALQIGFQIAFNMFASHMPAQVSGGLQAANMAGQAAQMPPDEFDQNGNKISNLGGDQIDFYHQKNGDTKIIDKVTGASNVILRGESLIRSYTQRPKNISWSKIAYEWDQGKGPAKSLIADFENTTQGAFGSLDNAFSSYASKAREASLNSSKLKDFVKMTYINANPLAAKDMWEQMWGRANINWYKMGDKTLFLMTDSKSMTSASYRISPNWERTKFKQNGNTYQTYIWTETNTEIQNKTLMKSNYINWQFKKILYQIGPKH